MSVTDFLPTGTNVDRKDVPVAVNVSAARLTDHRTCRSRSIVRGASVLLVACCAAGCNNMPGPLQPAPEVSESQPDSPADPTAGPAPAVKPKVDTTTPTLALIQASDEALHAGNRPLAITHLQRAIRIAPRNAELWLRLGRAYFADRRLGPARAHAEKCVRLADNNPALVRSAWLLIADIEEANGNTDTAADIRRRHQSMRG